MSKQDLTTKNRKRRKLRQQPLETTETKNPISAELSFFAGASIRTKGILKRLLGKLAYEVSWNILYDALLSLFTRR